MLVFLYYWFVIFFLSCFPSWHVFFCFQPPLPSLASLFPLPPLLSAPLLSKLDPSPLPHLLTPFRHPFFSLCSSSSSPFSFFPPFFPPFLHLLLPLLSSSSPPPTPLFFSTFFFVSPLPVFFLSPLLIFTATSPCLMASQSFASRLSPSDR